MGMVALEMEILASWDVCGLSYPTRRANQQVELEMLAQPSEATPWAIFTFTSNANWHPIFLPLVNISPIKVTKQDLQAYMVITPLY